MKFNKLIKDLMEDYSGTGGNAGAMGSGNIVDLSVNSPEDPLAVYVPAKDGKKKKKKDDEDEELEESRKSPDVNDILSAVQGIEKELKKGSVLNNALKQYGSNASWKNLAQLMNLLIEFRRQLQLDSEGNK